MSARALQIRGYKFDWQDVEWLTVVIRGPVAVYLLLRGRWASGSRHVMGLATDARCMAVRSTVIVFDLDPGGGADILDGRGSTTFISSRMFYDLTDRRSNAEP